MLLTNAKRPPLVWEFKKNQDHYEIVQNTDISASRLCKHSRTNDVIHSNRALALSVFLTSPRSRMHRRIVSRASVHLAALCYDTASSHSLLWWWRWWWWCQNNEKTLYFLIKNKRKKNKQKKTTTITTANSEAFKYLLTWQTCAVQLDTAILQIHPLDVLLTVTMKWALCTFCTSIVRIRIILRVYMRCFGVLIDWRELFPLVWVEDGTRDFEWRTFILVTLCNCSIIQDGTIVNIW